MRIAATSAILCLISGACFAQPIQQSTATITPGHPLVWVTNGVAGDGGDSTNGSLTSIGITGAGTPLGINDQSVTSPGGFHGLYLGANSAGGGLISYGSFGGASTLPISLSVNGATVLTTDGSIATANGNWHFTGSTTIDSISLSSLNNTPIGNITPSTGAFTTLAATGAASLLGGGTHTGTFTGGTFSGITLGGSITGTGATITGGTLSGMTVVTLSDGSGHNSGVKLGFPTLTSLIAFKPTNLGVNNVLATTAGFATVNDGGGAEYAWDATATDVDALGSNVFTITPTGWVGAGRWHMVKPSSGVNVLAAGLKCDAMTKVTISSGTYNSGTGEVVLTLASSLGISAGTKLMVSFTTGTGSNTSLEGAYFATSGTSGTSVHYFAATGLTATLTGGQVASWNATQTDDRLQLVRMGGNLRSMFNGGIMFVPPGKSCYIGSTMSLSYATEIRGAGQFGQTPESNLMLIPSIAVSAAGFSTGTGSVDLKDLSIGRYGVMPAVNMEDALAIQQAIHNDNSTCLTLSGSRILLRDVQVYGCSRSIIGTPGQTKFDRVNVDGTDFGINFTSSGGQILLDHVYAHDFLSAQVVSTLKGVTSGLYGSNALTIGVDSGGYTDGQNVTLSAGSAGLTCTTLPVLQLHVVGGVVQTDSTWIDRGSCSAITSNPASFTGGSGAGLTLNLDWRDARYRGGTGIRFADIDAPRAAHLWSEEYHIGMEVHNSHDDYINDFGTEFGFWGAAIGSPGDHIVDASSVGLLITGCANGGRIDGVHSAGGGGWAIKVVNDSGCSRADVTLANVAPITASIIEAGGISINGTNFGHVALTTLDICCNFFIDNGAGGTTEVAPVQMDANAKVVIDGVLVDSNLTNVPTWFAFDAATANQISITGTQPYRKTLNSGSSATAYCGLVLSVNDTTAPTITMPEGCPKGQPVTIIDTGGNAAAHNITLNRSGAGTINGTTSFVINTNFKNTVVTYDGNAAYTN